jgi:hypothetical protein
MGAQEQERRPRRLLVVANETSTAPRLLEEVRRRGPWADEVVLVVPALNTRLRHWLSDTDGALAAARERLQAAQAALAGAGVPVRGMVGDADPLQAIDDVLRELEVSEVLISTHAPGRSNWLERGVVERARMRFALPVAHLDAGEPARRAA